MAFESMLIADPDDNLVESLRDRCESLGLKVYVAFDAFNVVNLVADKRPDLLCLGPSLPGADGLKLLESLIDSGHISGTPVFVIGTTADAEARWQCERLGVHWIARSPHRVSGDLWSQLADSLSTLLGRHVPLVPAPITTSAPVVPVVTGLR